MHVCCDTVEVAEAIEDGRELEERVERDQAGCLEALQ